MTLIKEEFKLTHELMNKERVRELFNMYGSSLFVYGTLKKFAMNGNFLNHILKEERLMVDEFTIDGVLLSLTAYPLLILDNGYGTTVTGEIWRIKNIDTFIRLITAEMGAGIYSLYYCVKAGYSFFTFALSSDFNVNKFYTNYPLIKNGLW
jgi:gamma-glutamylcyclotransferase (GGCT)/AIG2-like uncharacterized protein YtfP